MTQNEIPLNKKKLTLIFMGCLVFIAIGILFVINPTFINGLFRDPAKILLVGYASIFIFGLCGFLIALRLTAKNSGIFIDKQGITDNSSAASAGLILWTDIEEVSVINIHSQKQIMIHVKKPQSYIHNQTNMFKRIILTLNYKWYGTPLTIMPTGLKISFDELIKIISDNFNASQQKSH
jgi:hypothetical protein